MIGRRSCCCPPRGFTAWGLDVEAARERLRRLVEEGVPYDSQEMLEAYEDFTELDKQWKGLEQQHLELKEELRREREGSSEEE